MQNRVFVLDKHKEPLMPCHPARARQLLRDNKAVVFRRFPFTIIIKQREGGVFQKIRLKFDPGASITGLALVGDNLNGLRCYWAAELIHRGNQIKKALGQRKGVRRSRRRRKTRYRKPRFKNRRRAKGWLPPSLQSRVDNISSWTKRLLRLVPITALSMELVRFDTQAMENPEIKGVEYQQGTLMGYEVREYLLEKWGRKCVYCQKQNIPLQVEHMVPKSRDGSDRVSNLTLSCGPCNQSKGTKTAEEFGFPTLQSKGKQSLRSAAIANATRLAIHVALEQTGLDVESGTGGRTKYNRTAQAYRKEHWLDAMCVGESGQEVYVEEEHAVLEISAMGRGSRQMCRVDKYGFPRTKPKSQKRVRGYQTGDLVKAVVTKGKKQGVYQGRVAIRKNGYFNIDTGAGVLQGISWRYFCLVQRTDGYRYKQRRGVSSPTKSVTTVDLVGVSTPSKNQWQN